MFAQHEYPGNPINSQYLILTLMQKSYFKIETVLATWEGRNKGKVFFYYFPCFFFFFFLVFMLFNSFFYPWNFQINLLFECGCISVAPPGEKFRNDLEFSFEIWALLTRPSQIHVGTLKLKSKVSAPWRNSVSECYCKVAHEFFRSIN